MRQGEAFVSGANKVTFCRWKDKEAVRKEYKEKLKNYPVCWPISREQVEVSILQKLHRIEEKRNTNQAIHFPEIYNEEKKSHVLWMEYCKGKTLAKWSPEQLQKAPVWNDFFRFLYHLKELDKYKIEYMTQGAIFEQETIRNCMMHWKLKDQKLPDIWKPTCLVLGDMSVNNIIFDGKRLTLIDFECAHWGYEGYDVGQFLGMAHALWKTSTFPGYLEQILKNNIQDKKWIEKCMYWKQMFMKYYT